MLNTGSLGLQTACDLVAEYYQKVCQHPKESL